jgi:general secretion pathway protein H
LRVCARLRPLTRSSPGFSLFELIVVMLIVAIAGAFVAPSISSGWRSRQVRQGARRIAGVMRGLRERAVRRGVEQVLILDPDGVTFRWSDGQEAALPDGVSFTDIKGGWRDADGSARVIFYPNGGSSGLGIIVAHGPHEGLQFAIEVEPLLGSVVIREVSG